MLHRPYVRLLTTTMCKCKSELFLYKLCSACSLLRLTCSRKGQSCWWSCYGHLGPCQVKRQGFGCRHPAPCWLEAGFWGRAPAHTHKTKETCLKPSKPWSEQTGFAGTKRKLNGSLNYYFFCWNHSKYRWEQIHVSTEEKGQNKLYWFYYETTHTCTIHCQWVMRSKEWKNKQKNLNLQVLLSFLCERNKSLFPSNKFLWVTNLVMIYQWIV